MSGLILALIYTMVAFMGVSTGLIVSYFLFR